MMRAPRDKGGDSIISARARAAGAPLGFRDCLCHDDMRAAAYARASLRAVSPAVVIFGCRAIDAWPVGSRRGMPIRLAMMSFSAMAEVQQPLYAPAGMDCR